MLILTDLLIYELQVSNNKEIIADIKRLIKRLHQLSSDQQSSWLNAETYLLEARLALVELDFNEARKKLSIAQLAAEEKGLESLLKEFLMNMMSYRTK